MIPSIERFRRFSVGVLAYNLAVIAWGAFVRASGSGAGCGEHWPLCNGQVIPREPEVKTLIEFSHRLTSGLALVLVVAMMAWAFRIFPRGHAVRRASATSVVLILFEALIGAGLVILGLVHLDASILRAISMLLHLVNTFFLVAALALTAGWAWGLPSFRLLEAVRTGRGKISAGLFLLLCAVGGSGAIAALGDTLFPAKTLAEGIARDFDGASHFLLQLRTIHPVLALIAAGALVWLGRATLGKAAPGSPLARAARILVWAVATQTVFGFVNLGLLAPTWGQIVHLLLADAVVIAFTLFAAEWIEPRKPAFRE